MPLIAVENILLLQNQFTQPPRTAILLGGKNWCSECGPDCKVDIYFNQVCLSNSVTEQGMKYNHMGGCGV